MRVSVNEFSDLDITQWTSSKLVQGVVRSFVESIGGASIYHVVRSKLVCGRLTSLQTIHSIVGLLVILELSKLQWYCEEHKGTRERKPDRWHKGC